VIKDKRNFLIELVGLPELADNTIALVFAQNPNLDISSREKFYENVVGYFNRYRQTKPEIVKEITGEDNSVESWYGKDLRIKSVRLKSVRGYPDSEIPFGMDFVNGAGEPESIIILGGNASGKSSLYDSIEYCYCNSIGEALLRAYKQGTTPDLKFREFLRHLDNPSSSTYCRIETVAESFDIQNENIPQSVREKINPETHFISDYDIFIKGQLDYESNTDRSFHNTIAESLGLSELLRFERNLKAFLLYRRQTESRNVSSLRRSNETLLRLIENNEAAISQKRLLLSELQQTQQSNPSEVNLKEILDKAGQINVSTLSFSFDPNLFVRTIDEFINIQDQLRTQEIRDLGMNEANFLSLGLELLKEHENCPFCRSSSLSHDELTKNVNHRIKAIHELMELTRNLNGVTNALVDAMQNFKNQVDLLRSRIVNEIKIIQNNIEFNDLLQSDNQFLNRTSEFSSHEFYGEIASLNENPSFLRDRGRYLLGLVNKYRDYINTDMHGFVDSISRFLPYRSNIFQRIESEIVEKTRTKTIAEQMILVTKEINDLERQVISAKKEVEKDEARINELMEVQISFDRIKEETRSYQKVVHNVMNKEVEKAFAPIKLVVEEVLESYFEADNRSVDLIISKQPDEIDQETGEALSEIITAKIIPKTQGATPQSVTKYLNTFHYRLFSSLVAVSVAIASRIATRINIPVVLDDIFYASDFENKTTIEQFLKEMFTLFDKYTPKMPLQLILFTHDQQIFESAIKVTRQNGFKLSYAKLFPPGDAKIEGDYLNLVYKFSEFSMQKLTDSLVSKYDHEL
jgi:hypothetical protein